MQGIQVIVMDEIGVAEIVASVGQRVGEVVAVPEEVAISVA